MLTFPGLTLPTIGTRIEKIQRYLADERWPSPFRVEALMAMKGVDLETLTALINKETVYEIISLGSYVERKDVITTCISFVADPRKLLASGVILNDDACLDALLARLTPGVLNAKTYRQHLNKDVPYYPSHDQKACWEVVIDLDEDVPDDVTDERFLTTILPKLHAAGADLMDDRFAPIEGQIHLGQFAPGRIALATYRRQVLNAELHALADEEAPEPAPSRTRARL
ncbi:TPA: hypothetical protein QDB45_001661 [Burkholderia vietnamiensis]|nr:hypothetical protein [Burkholderia vietnamiensis]